MENESGSAGSAATSSVTAATAPTRSRPEWPVALMDAAIGVALDAIPALVQFIRDLIARSGTPVCRETLTLKDAFEFFAQNKARNPLAAAGAIVRAAADDTGTRIVLLFLDQSRKPLVSGPAAAPVASYLVRSLDHELDEAFGTSNVIVVS